MEKTAKDVAIQIEQFRERYPDADYSIGHVVFADGNLSRDVIYSCFEPNNFRLWLGNVLSSDDVHEWQKHYMMTGEVVKFLVYLMQKYSDDFLADVMDALAEMRARQ